MTIVPLSASFLSWLEHPAGGSPTTVWTHDTGLSALTDNAMIRLAGSTPKQEEAEMPEVCVRAAGNPAYHSDTGINMLAGAMDAGGDPYSF